LRFLPKQRARRKGKKRGGGGGGKWRSKIYASACRMSTVIEIKKRRGGGKKGDERRVPYFIPWPRKKRGKWGRKEGGSGQRDLWSFSTWPLLKKKRKEEKGLALLISYSYNPPKKKEVKKRGVEGIFRGGKKKGRGFLIFYFEGLRGKKKE